jgi:hypothetical protein
MRGETLNRRNPHTFGHAETFNHFFVVVKHFFAMLRNVSALYAQDL